MLTTTAVADSGGQNDAGSGADAGNTRDLATRVAMGASHLNNKLRVGDVDWYSAEASNAGTSCVRARVTATGPTYFALATETAGASLTAPFFADAGRDASAGIAGPTPLVATLRAAQTSAENGQTKYNFTIERVDVSANGDAGSGADAGDSSSGAIPISAGCVSGTLSALDLRDTYSISVLAGDVVTYSLASAESAVRVTLVDAIGNAIGPSIGAGESASLGVANPGTYFLSSAQPGSLSSAAYAVGVIVGPDEDACRPFCVG